MTKYSECPRCGCCDLRDMWQRGRKLRQECCECGWVGEARTPEQQEIKTTRRLNVCHGGGHTFEVYDKYGHIYILSRSYPSAEEAEAAMQKEIDWGKENSIAGPYTGILWPATIEATGEVFK